MTVKFAPHALRALLFLSLFAANATLVRAQDNAIYVVHNDTSLSIITNQATGTTAAVTGGTLSFGTSAAARDPLTGRIYYLSTNAATPVGRVSYWNPATQTNTAVNTVGSPGNDNVVRLTFNSAGVMYGLGGGGNLYTIGTSAPGTYTQVGTLPVKVTNRSNVNIPTAGDIAFGPDGVLYAAANCTSGVAGATCLYSINPVANPTALEIGTVVTLSGGAVMASLAFGIDGTLYAGASNGNYYSISTATGVGTLRSSGGAAYWDFAVMPKFANLSITKTDSPDPVFVGNALTYTIVVTNNGPQAATNIQMSDPLPAGTLFQSATQPAGWTCTTPAVGANGTVNCTNGTTGSIANGATATFQLVVTTPNVTGTISNTAMVTSDTIDSVTTNDSATQATNVNFSSIAGTIFEDVNYGGGAGRSLAAAAGNVRPNARVELYNASGAFVSATTTDAGGQYNFPGLVSGNYTVRVVNSTVSSSRPGYVNTLLPVQSFRANASTGAAVSDPSRVGGERPSVADAGNGAAGTTLNTTTGAFTAGITGQAQSIAPVTLNGGNLTGLDFGFNFDTVVNINDSGQGSLRQFIINSNTLTNGGLNQAGLTAGRETTLFMISDGAAHPGLRAGLTNLFSAGAAPITLTAALPSITDANTAIDGTRQTAITGDTNAAINESTTGPEIIIDVAAGPGLQSVAANTIIDSVGVMGANGAAAIGAGIFFDGASVAGSIIRNSTVWNNDDGGITIQNGATGVQVTNNITRNNGQTTPNADGLELVGASGNTISGNQMLNNPGYGIDLRTTSNNNNTITGNLIKNNGASATDQDAGIGLRTGSNNTISLNTITGNQGDGIVVLAGANTGNTFTRNSIFANGDLGIDLGGANTGDGVTVNDNGDGDTGANDLLNFPVLTDAFVSGANLVLNGFARPGSVIELFVAAPDATGFGEGQTYLVTLTEGSAGDADATVGLYTSPVNGRNVGTDLTNRFQFTIPLPAGVSTGTALTATATLSANTSEFSNYYTVTNTAAAPNIVLTKSINPPDGSTQLPGTELTYSITFTNTGLAAARNLVITDPNLNTALRINDNTDFKVGSVVSNLGTTGLTVAVSYSNDGGATYAYTPASGGGGAPANYDRNVTHVRWSLTGALSPFAPNNTGSIGFIVRIR